MVEETPTYVYRELSADEIRNLARDIVGGRIFGSWMLAESDFHLVQSIFMPLALCGPEHLAQMKNANLGQIYEYLDKAGSMAINGFPMFMSMKVLNVADARRVFDAAMAMETALSNVVVE